MNKSEVFGQFVLAIENMNEVEFGDYKRKLGTYLLRLTESLDRISPADQQILAAGDWPHSARRCHRDNLPDTGTHIQRRAGFCPCRSALQGRCRWGVTLQSCMQRLQVGCTAEKMRIPPERG